VGQPYARLFRTGRFKLFCSEPPFAKGFFYATPSWIA